MVLKMKLPDVKSYDKSATFTPPQDQLTNGFHIEYDIKKSWGPGGGTGPIQASWPSFLYPSTSELIARQVPWVYISKHF